MDMALSHETDATLAFGISSMGMGVRLQCDQILL